MKFVIEPEIFEMFPGMEIVAVVVHGIDNQSLRPQVKELLLEAWKVAGDEVRAYPSVQEHPRIKAWGDAMKEVGVSRKKFPPSIEAMARRALKSPEPFQISPVVDFYNAISLKSLVPAGAYDLDQLDSLTLGVSQSGDTFQAMDEPEALVVDPGEVSYRDGSHILTRHFVWRQAVKGLVQPASQSILIVSEVLPAAGLDAKVILQEILSGLTDYFHIQGRGEILSAENREMTLT